MMITLPNDLEDRLQASVDEGRFASVDDAMAEAARLLVRKLGQKTARQPENSNAVTPDTILGSMHKAADELDQIVADVY